MSYLIFARKYRPQTFDEVVGQEHVVRTLTQAITQDRLAQSFLFTGSRGVGKTSMARILAKALNCAQGPTDKPCGKCVTCTEIANGSSLDTLEIDGASNRGIDEIRALREQVRFKPTSGRYRVYIIDEVHMLTTEAFNALLKTLEEPPVHVKFVFATTEPAKVPMTIVSRCQRYHFKPIPLRLIKEKLAEIVSLEKLKAPDDVLFILARAAEGSLRDAESLLDQLASFTKGKLTAEDALEAFGITSEETILNAIDRLAGRDAPAILSQIEELTEEGKDLGIFVDELSQSLRHLLIFQSVKEPQELVEVSDHFFAELERRKGLFGREDLLYMLTVLTRAAQDLRRSESPRLILELALIRLISREALQNLSEILAEIRMLHSEKGTPAEGEARLGRPSTRPAISPAARGEVREGKEAVPGPAARTMPAKTEKSADRGRPVKAESSGFEIEGKKETANAFDPGFSDDEIPSAPEREVGTVYAASAKTATAILEEENPRKAETPAAESPADAALPFSLSIVEELWPKVLERVKAKKMSTGNYLAETEPLDTNGNVLVLGMDQEFSFHKEALERKEHKEIVLEVCRDVFGPAIQVKLVILTDEAVGGRGTAKNPAGSEPVKLPPIVESAAELFGGRVIQKRSS